MPVVGGTAPFRSGSGWRAFILAVLLLPVASAAATWQGAGTGSVDADHQRRHADTRAQAGDDDAATAEPTPRTHSSVAEALAAHPDLGVFAALLEEAGLVPLVSGAYPVTLFAPTDAAFEALDEGELERVRSDHESLERFIRFHVLEDDIIVTPNGRLTGNGALNPVSRLLFWPDGDR